MHESKQRRLLVLSNVWVEPNSSAAGWRMERLLDLFLEYGYTIDYASTAAPSELALDLRFKEIQVHQIQVNDDAVNEWLKDLKPHIVLFDRFMVEEQFGWRVAEHLPSSIRILNTEDLHGLRYAREAALLEERAFNVLDLNRGIMFRELAAIHRCDLTLVISDVEMALLKDHFKIDDCLLHYLPFFIPKAAINRVLETPGFESRVDFITIGNFKHAPNGDAVQVLREKVWPLVKSVMPDANLRVYGAYATPAIQQWHAPEHGFYVGGHVPSVRAVMEQGRVLLAPLRFGAGLKGKLVDAMRHGLPSVTTAIGAEGIASPEQWPGFVSDDWTAFAENAVRLYSDENVWQEAQRKTANVLYERFGSAAYEARCMERLADITANLNEHRSRNWIGEMLHLNSQKSYTYLSKWIMAKTNHRSQ